MRPAADVVSRDHSRGVDACGKNATPTTWSIDDGDLPVAVPHEAINWRLAQTCEVIAYDLVRCVDGCGKGSDRFRRIEGGEFSITITHETGLVIPLVVVPDNLSLRVHGRDEGSSRARRIEACDGAVAIAQEAMRHIVGVMVSSRDFPRGVNACGYG